MNENELKAAGAAAEQLARAVDQEDGALAPVYESLDVAIAELTDGGYQPSDLLPVGAEPGLGFSLNEKRDGKTLWQAISIAGRDSLCDSGSELRRRLSGEGNMSASALVALIMASLGLPAIAVAIAIAVAGYILAVGLPGFCNWAKAEPDGPPAA